MLSAYRKLQPTRNAEIRLCSRWQRGKGLLLLVDEEYIQERSFEFRPVLCAAYIYIRWSLAPDRALSFPYDRLRECRRCPTTLPNGPEVGWAGCGGNRAGGNYYTRFRVRR